MLLHLLRSPDERLRMPLARAMLKASRLLNGLQDVQGKKKNALSMFKYTLYSRVIDFLLISCPFVLPQTCILMAFHSCVPFRPFPLERICSGLLNVNIF